MLGFLGVTANEVKILESQLRTRFEAVAASLPPETAQKIYDDLNAIAAFRQLSESAQPPWSDPGAVAAYDALVRKAESTWQSTLSRTWQQGVAEARPWYKKSENIFIMVGAVVALTLLVSFTGPRKGA